MRNFLSLLLSGLDFISEKSGFRMLVGAYVAKMQAKSQANCWVPKDFIPSQTKKPELLKKLLIHLHVYNESYIHQARAIISDFPDAGGILITSPFEEVLHEFETTSKSDNLEVRLVKNVGRNFGAIKQIASAFGSFEYFLHLHSKASKQMSTRRSAEWSRFYWQILANRGNVMRILSVMDSDSSITVSYPELTTVLPSKAYRWGNNKKLAEAILADSKIDLMGGQIAFPAGGMFICRTVLIMDLMRRVGLEDFPQEPFPLDGSIAHALERLLGVYGLDGRPVHLVLTSQGLITTDTGFKSHKGVWG